MKKNRRKKNTPRKEARPMSKIFTKKFFRLTAHDQAALVDAVIRDLESCIGRNLNPEDDRKVRQHIRRIERKAVEYGVYEDLPDDRDQRAGPGRRRDLRLWEESDG
jgi:tRNA splicing endonuclease